MRLLDRTGAGRAKGRGCEVGPAAGKPGECWHGVGEVSKRTGCPLPVTRCPTPEGFRVPGAGWVPGAGCRMPDALGLLSASDVLRIAYCALRLSRSPLTRRLPCRAWATPSPR